MQNQKFVVTTITGSPIATSRTPLEKGRQGLPKHEVRLLLKILFLKTTLKYFRNGKTYRNKTNLIIFCTFCMLPGIFEHHPPSNVRAVKLKTRHHTIKLWLMVQSCQTDKNPISDTLQPVCQSPPSTTMAHGVTSSHANIMVTSYWLLFYVQTDQIWRYSGG